MEAAPDLLGMDVEGVEAPSRRPHHGLPLAARPGTALPMAGRRCRRSGSGWLDLDGVADLPEGATTAAPAGDVAVLVANVNGTLLAYRDACAACGSPLHGGRLGGGSAGLPVLLGALRPAAGGPGRRRRRPAARARSRCCATGRRGSGSRSPHERALTAAAAPRWRRPAPARDRAAARGRRRPPRDGERCDLCGRRVPADHRHLLQLERAADRLRVRGVLGAALGRSRVPARWARAWRGCPTWSCADERWASFGIPIGLAFFMRSSVAGGVVGCTRARRAPTESRAGPRRPGTALVARQPGAGRAGVRRRGADRQPPGHAAPVRDRARSTTATGWSALVKASWEGISGGAGARAGDPRLLRRAARRGRRDRAGGDDWTIRRPASGRSAVHGARGRAGHRSRPRRPCASRPT